MSAEWNLVGPDVQVRQGDILVARDPASGVVVETVLVITADCDISKGKFGRQLGCLRMLPISKYYREIWGAKKLRRFVSAESSQLLQQLAKWHSEQIGASSNLTVEGSRRWLTTASSVQICEALKVPIELRPKLAIRLDAYREAFEAAESIDEDPFHRLAKAKSAMTAKPLDECEEALMQQAKKEELPEDAFLLTSLPHYEATLEPHFVLLRELVGIAYESIVYRASDASSTDLFLRTGRLEPTFKYAISQAFGSLYSRIGLPSDYEARRDSAVVEMTLRRR